MDSPVTVDQIVTKYNRLRDASPELLEEIHAQHFFEILPEESMEDFAEDIVENEREIALSYYYLLSGACTALDFRDVILHS